MKTGYITHPAYLAHDTGPGHPESSRRLAVLDQEILRKDTSTPPDILQNRLKVITPTLIDDLDRWILEVHLPSHLRLLKEKQPISGRIYLDPDTPCAPGSYFAAQMAVSGLLTAIDGVMAQEIQNAFCAVRPPGHHAEADRAMGFCLFNQIAIGSRYLQRKHGLGKIFIIDWDVHHGNGTQHTFYEDPSVYYFSTHQFPFYPGTGAREEQGASRGKGCTQNIPLSAGAGDLEIIAIFEKELADAVAVFQPDFILISAGFDAHRDDPLAALNVTEAGFETMTKIVRALAETHCGGRVVSCLEGGYNLDALARSVEKHLQALSRA
ncbi:MAG: histone deacetylase [Nitrospiria bacterium]